MPQNGFLHTALSSAALAAASLAVAVAVAQAGHCTAEGREEDRITLLLSPEM
jgi:hypothetical protein